jgi:radical SAM superfamily enzyme YgiQ (UPF0313 family)
MQRTCNLDSHSGAEVNMKLLLVAINAKYIHSNLAVYSLKAYADRYRDRIGILELTINHSEEDILKEIYLQKAEVIAFSCYIWNISIVERVSAELRKVQPEVKIWYGGPEVSYDSRHCLEEHPQLDGIMMGEGEQTFLELSEYYLEGMSNLEDIAGLCFAESAKTESARTEYTKIEYIKTENTKTENTIIMDSKTERNDLSGNRTITITGDRQPIALDAIPFPYEDMESFKNRIIYYESSRGCPFSCSYCLSSIDKRVRFRSSSLVKQELKFFLDYLIPQVKFVDRTFNCNKKHAMDIWNFIKEQDNGLTNFHFEISADLLEEDEIEFLATLRPGLVQFEIGVQSTNPDTVEAIHRRMEFEKVARNVTRIKEGGNIHQHLDLIAGLPRESYSIFEQSFRDVYNLKPDQLQLGFLKILKGSSMEEDSRNFGIVYRDTAPYEVLFSDELSYEDLLRIKGICEMVEIYYNSGQFTYSIGFLEHSYSSPMKLYQQLSDYYENTDISLMAHSRIKRYEILLDFYQSEVLESAVVEEKADLLALFKELLIFDLFLREDMKARPGFSPIKPKQSSLRPCYEKYQLPGKQIHIEQFQYDLTESMQTGKAVKKTSTVLFDYSRRDPLNRAAETTILE